MTKQRAREVLHGQAITYRLGHRWSASDFEDSFVECWGCHPPEIEEAFAAAPEALEHIINLVWNL